MGTAAWPRPVSPVPRALARTPERSERLAPPGRDYRRPWVPNPPAIIDYLPACGRGVRARKTRPLRRPYFPAFYPHTSPALHSWVPDADASAFPLRLLPLGVRRRPDGSHATVARIGDYVADLRVLAEIGLFDDCGTTRGDFARPSLNALLAPGSEPLSQVRARLRQCLAATPTYYDLRERREIFLLPHRQAHLTAAVQPRDLTLAETEYTLTLRASSLLESDAGVPRLAGAASEALAVTAGVAAVLTGQSVIGSVLSPAAARAHVFGFAAALCFRDSGTPVTAPPYATVLSPWVTPAPALEASELALSHTPYRRRQAQVTSARAGGVLAQAATILAQLTRRGARLGPGDILLLPVAKGSCSEAVDGDEVCLTGGGLAPVRATVTAPRRA